MTRFRHDQTVRWPCRSGDYIIWASYSGGLLPGGRFKPRDLWQLFDGDVVTLTNRKTDLPEDFQLHPLEIAEMGEIAMLRLIAEGSVPSEPVNADNLWRVRVGDRLAWVGRPRTGPDNQTVEVLELMIFDSDALVFGEPTYLAGGAVTFGGFDVDDETAEREATLRIGWNAIVNEGPPDRISARAQWRLG